MPGKLHLGLDIGSVSANMVLLDDQAQVIEESYTRTKGRPAECAAKILSDLLERQGPDKIASVSLTGIAAKAVASGLDAPFVNEIISQARAVAAFYPEVRTIIDMGGEDSKLIILDSHGRGEIEDFAMNSMCAAGTGSFLDQQAHRLGLTIEQFSDLALKSETPPRVAGRCSVFAKTDMIHLQQEAAPDYDIVAGLCFALARNLKSNIARGRNITPPVAFQGGVAANHGVRRALKEVMNLEDEQLVIPERFFSMGAIGAALLTLDGLNEKVPLSSLDDFLAFVSSRNVEAGRLEPLSLGEHHGRWPDKIRQLGPDDKNVPAYLGVDVGSISTNVVLIDEQGALLSKQYLMTAGRPLEAVKEGLRLAGAEVGDKVKIMGAGTTGSGRYLTGAFIGADIVRNEITAQATASAEIDPEVDTIFEIGGQDSKYISLKNGAIVDFTMNKVCAAGTGSFLEEQAEKLGISIKEEFGRLALASRKPVQMGERCTVFMESDIVHHQQQSVPVDDIVGGLSYSIVYNYLNKVVENRPVGEKIFYQGATAHNAGIVAAFEKVTGKPIHVPPHNDVTGAIGVALLAMRERTWQESSFKGFSVAESDYKITSFECQGCPNRCEIRKVIFEGAKRPLFYGSRCDKYDVDQDRRQNDIPDLFALRESWLLGEDEDSRPLDKPRGVIGIPRTMFFRDLLPFFRIFFRELGFEIVVSDLSNKTIIHAGVERIVAETCFPIKVAHGHILDLVNKGINRIFLPSIINIEHPNPAIGSGQVCPYAQTLTYTCHSSIDLAGLGVEMIAPVLRFGDGDQILKKGLRQLARQIGAPELKFNRAFKRAREAQDAFQEKCLAKGREIIGGLGPDGMAMVFVSRPYNGFDAGLNLGLHRKLRDLGVLSMPMDFLDLDGVEDLEGLEGMYWRYGQKILSAAKLIKADPRLHAVYVTNFGCGPDSFLLHFFRDYMQGRPYLEIEIDEHSADVGAMTRLEAFLDSIKNVPLAELTTAPPPRAKRQVKRQGDRIIYIPPMTDHSYAVAAAFEGCGVEARVLPDSDDETLGIGRRFTSGKECYPCILTTGDMVKLVQNNGFNRDRAAFFMPTGDGPCRFGCYHRLHRMVLDEIGFPDVPIYSPTQNRVLYEEIGQLSEDFTRWGWMGMVGVDVIQKKALETRPYEINPGQTDQVYSKALKRISQAVRDHEDVVEVMRETRGWFESIPVKDLGSKPVVGIVGEIYTRANRFANEDVIGRLEELG
ncbi:MAG: CoA activase, partial [Deltaproteobacteria bacterium]|nr:CoA activase [Deltaproteobacteria bacterium]